MTCVDPCLGVDCGAHGVCNRFSGGSCECTDGFSGAACGVEPICPRINYAAAANGGSVVSSHTQGGFDVSESIDGALGPADNGWAYGGGASRETPRSAVYAFREPATIDSFEALSGIGRNDHHLAEIALWYTTDAVPVLEGGSWQPLTGVHWLVGVTVQGSLVAPGSGVIGNELVMDGQQDVQVGFDAVLSTGVRVDVLGTSAGNGNVVLTELTVLGVPSDRCIPSSCPRADVSASAAGGTAVSSHTQDGYDVSESIDGVVTSAGNGWAFGGGASRDEVRTAVYTLSERSSVDQIDVISGIDREDHMVAGVKLFYTDDKEVDFGSQWSELTSIRDLDPVDGLSIVGSNEVTASGQHYMRLSFNPVVATGVKLEIFETTADNSNVVLTELVVGGYPLGKCVVDGDAKGGH